MHEIYGQLLFYVNALWQRRWLALSTAWAACLAGWVTVATIPDSFTSSGRIYVDTLSVLQPLLSGLAVEQDIESELVVMKQTLLSRPNLLKVARVTDLDLTATTETELDQLVDELRGNTKVVANEQHLFWIGYDSDDPVKARDIVQALITIFVESNLGENRTDMDAARQFLDEQIQAYEIQLEEAEQRKARFKQRNLGLLPGSQGYHGRLERTQENLKQIKAQLQEGEAQLAVIQRELTSIPEYLTVGQGAGIGPPSISETRIVELETALDNLLTRYTEKHPDVINVQRRLDRLYQEREEELQAALEFVSGEGDLGSDDGDVDGIPNPLYGQLQIRAIEQEANVEVLRARERELEARVAEIENLASAVPVVEAEYAKLNRDYNVLHSKYQELISRRESAKISQDREVRAEKVQFRIVEPPKVPTLPSGPNRPLYLAAATIVGLGVGVGFALLTTILDTTYANPSNLGSAFRLPVYGTVSSIASLRRRRFAFANITATFVVFLGIPTVLVGLLIVESQVGLGSIDVAGLGTGYIDDLMTRVNGYVQNFVGGLMGQIKTSISLGGLSAQ
ncbi:MAG: hypothetical protein MI920_22915 [Kiloniellales bacterium]|nr:hypothetical protein [Kiloniellales bacterium]